MERNPSDVTTFKSALRKENLPDFTIVCGDYRWKVHSHLFATHSKAFRAIFEEGDKREWITRGDDAAVLGHLILWCYEGRYGDLGGVHGSSDLDIKTIMTHGNTSPDKSRPPPSDDGEDGADEEEEEGKWMPEALHAKMYLLARKYGIVELQGRAAEGIEADMEMIDEAEFVETTLLPVLVELLAPRVVKVEDAKEEQLRLSADKDSRVWKMLVDVVVTAMARLRDEACLVAVMHHNPAFNLDVTFAMQDRLVNAETKIEELNAQLKPPKAGRKRKASAPCQQQPPKKAKGAAAAAAQPA